MVILIGWTSQLFLGVTLAPPLVLDVQSALALMANAIRSRRATWDHSTIHYVGSIIWGIGLGGTVRLITGTVYMMPAPW